MVRSRSASVVLGFVVMTAAGGGALAGCSAADPEPRIAPSSPVSASASASESARARDQAVDEAFISDFFHAVGRSTLSGDTSKFVTMTAPGCANCLTLASNIKGAYAAGGHVEGGDWRVIDARQSGAAASPRRFWSVKVKTARERWFDGDGNLVKVVRPSTQTFGLLLSSAGDRPLVQDMRLQS